MCTRLELSVCFACWVGFGGWFWGLEFLVIWFALTLCSVGFERVVFGLFIYCDLWVVFVVGECFTLGLLFALNAFALIWCWVTRFDGISFDGRMA